MKIKIITAFQNSKDEFENLAQDYLKRTKLPFRLELKQVKPNKVLAESDKCYRILLDEKGREFNSLNFAKHLNKLIESGRPLAFLIGASDGHEDTIQEKADESISISKMTVPHKLALCIFSEQIYRAGEILRGGPYHRE